MVQNKALLVPLFHHTHSMEYIVGKARMEFLVRALFGRLGKRSLIAIAEAPDDGGGAFLDFPRLLVTLSEALEAFEKLEPRLRVFHPLDWPVIWVARIYSGVPKAGAPDE